MFSIHFNSFVCWITLLLLLPENWFSKRWSISQFHCHFLLTPKPQQLSFVPPELLMTSFTWSSRNLGTSPYQPTLMSKWGSSLCDLYILAQVWHFLLLWSELPLEKILSLAAVLAHTKLPGIMPWAHCSWLSHLFFYVQGPNDWRQKNSEKLLLGSVPVKKILTFQESFTYCFLPRHSDLRLKSGHDGDWGMLVPLLTPMAELKWIRGYLFVLQTSINSWFI